MTASVVPAHDALPAVHATESISCALRLEPSLRRELHRIPDARNALTVLSVVAMAVGLVVGAAMWGTWYGYVIAFVLMPGVHIRMFVLGHEAAHGLLFSNRALNDAVWLYLLDLPLLGTATPGYRRVHMSHHRDELGPNEPDKVLYSFYPQPWSSYRRKLRRDVTGVSWFRSHRPVRAALGSWPPTRAGLCVIAGIVMTAAPFVLFGRPELYLALWVAPYVTLYWVFNRLRAIAEHGGMTRSSDRRQTTHHVRQRVGLLRWFMVPYNVGYHLAHHVDAGVSFRHLPRLHAELEACGYVDESVTYPSYRALWRSLVTRS